MIKKIIIAGWVCLFAASLHAQRKLNINLNQKDDTQVSPIVREKVEEYAAKINNIIQEEKRKMDLELQLLAEKKLPAETADREKAAIADRYSEKIDQRIEALGFDLDDDIGKRFNHRYRYCSALFVKYLGHSDFLSHYRFFHFTTSCND